jgi:hypothetical protein
MTLQSAVKFEEYFRCYVINQKKVHIMPYDPRRPFHERYVKDPPAYDAKLLERVERDALTLCRALGYDLNTVEFAVEDGVPYAIDFMNPAPDADVHSVGEANFRWIVDAVAEMAIEKAKQHAGTPAGGFVWSSFLAGKPVTKAAAGPGPATAAAATKKPAAKKAPAKKAARKSRKAPGPSA